MPGLAALVSGAVIGISIAAPVGPMAILCINRTLRAGIKAGISTGAGASTVHTAYASVVLLGLQQIGPLLSSWRPAMSAVSAGLMLLFACRILRRAPGSSSKPHGGSVLQNYGTAVAFNCFNPVLLVLLVAAVGVVIGPEPPLGSALSMALVGVFFGSVAWWIALSALTCALGPRLSRQALQSINFVAAAAMIAFAAHSIARALGT